MLTVFLEAAPAKESIWSLLGKGGPIMIPLGFLFAVVVYFSVERWLVLKKVTGNLDDNFMNLVREHKIGRAHV